MKIKFESWYLEKVLSLSFCHICYLMILFDKNCSIMQAAGMLVIVERERNVV